jgi:PadR family transcriptional regulator PadR
MKKSSLGSFEEFVLLSVAVIGEEAYGVTIKQELTERLNKSISVSALQTALRRLEDKGFLISKFGEATAVRGGKRKRYFKITAFGIKTLKETQELRMEMWQAIPNYELKYSF